MNFPKPSLDKFAVFPMWITAECDVTEFYCGTENSGYSTNLIAKYTVVSFLVQRMIRGTPMIFKSKFLDFGAQLEVLRHNMYYNCYVGFPRK